MTFKEACELGEDKMYEWCEFDHVLSLCSGCIHKDECPVSQYTGKHDVDELVWRCYLYEEG